MIPLSIGFNLEKFCCFILLYVEMLIVVVSFELFCYPPPPFLTPCAHETHCPFPHCHPPCPSTYPSCIPIALIPIHSSHTHLHFFLNVTKPIPSHYSVHIPPHACRHLSLSTPRSSCPLPIHMHEAMHGTMHATTLLCPPYPSFLTSLLSLHHPTSLSFILEGKVW